VCPTQLASAALYLSVREAGGFGTHLALEALQEGAPGVDGQLAGIVA
jgi:hypothetical protein